MLRTNYRLAAALFAAVATPATAAQTTAVTSVNVVKPVQLAKLQDLDFGTLTFSGFTGTRTITITQTGGFTCAADIVCSGAPKPARFNVQGTTKMTANILVTGGSMTNGTETIPFTASYPGTVYIPNSGAPGIDFGVGGSITVSPTILGGTYVGTLNVTAEYQ